MADLPTGTVTFLFTDIEASTRLLAELGDRYVEARAEYHRVIRAALAAHAGVEVDTQGDAFFAAFERRAELAGLLWGASDAFREDFDWPLNRIDRERYAAAVAPLDERAYERGRRVTLDEAVDTALASLD